MNLTPHEVRVFSPSGEQWVFPPSGQVARVAVSRKQSGVIPASAETVGDVVDGQGCIPVYLPRFGQAENLPEPERGKVFIVSALVRGAVPHRHDVFSPGDLRRDEKGQPIGCNGLDGN